MEARNLNQLWAHLVVEELFRCGIQHFIIAPGSRSAPLAVAALRHSQAVTVTHFDERGAAYLALGAGRMGRPAAVICTSGTAVANCYPAVIEASQSALPLIVLSADRPPELHGCGANQTMDQQYLFGRHVREFLALPCPDPHIAPEAVLSRVDAVVARATSPGDAGPVHINCMYREPLTPDATTQPYPKNYLEPLHGWRDSKAPYTDWRVAPRTLPRNEIQDTVNMMALAKHGLVLLGRMYADDDRDAALRLAEQLHWPVFADISSGCRVFADRLHMVDHYDLLLHAPAFQDFCLPDCIIHIGDVFVSKRLQQHLSRLSPVYLHLSERRDNRDAVARVTHRLQANIAKTCRQWAASLADAAAHDEILTQYASFDAAAEATLKRIVHPSKRLSDFYIAQEVVKLSREAERLLFLGNSMPVRVLDMAATDLESKEVHANRGVSGIDGNIATASGMAWAAGRRTVALIGDTTALHDLNSLALMATMKLPLTLIIINNGGGGIFSLLPIARQSDVFARGFLNPHAWRFEDAAHQFGIPYTVASTPETFKKALARSATGATPAIIEAVVDHDENVALHRRLLEAMGLIEAT